LWTESAIRRLEEMFPDDNHMNRIIWRMYLPHVRHALESVVVEEGEARADLIWRYARCLYSDGRWNEAEVIFRQVLEKEKRIHDPEDTRILTRMAWLASTFWNQGRWKEAEQLDVQVMETRKTVLGDDHPSTLTSMNNLAFTLKGQGRNEGALTLLQDCVQKRTQILGPNHPFTISSQATLNEWRMENLDLDSLDNNKEPEH
jgi:hypothetical protein